MGSFAGFCEWCEVESNPFGLHADYCPTIKIQEAERRAEAAEDTLREIMDEDDPDRIRGIAATYFDERPAEEQAEDGRPTAEEKAALNAPDEERDESWWREDHRVLFEAIHRALDALEPRQMEDGQGIALRRAGDAAKAREILTDALQDRKLAASPRGSVPCPRCNDLTDWQAGMPNCPEDGLCGGTSSVPKAVADLYAEVSALREKDGAKPVGGAESVTQTDPASGKPLCPSCGSDDPRISLGRPCGCQSPTCPHRCPDPFHSGTGIQGEADG